MSDTTINSLLQPIRSSYLPKIALIGVVILLLQIPIAQIRSIIREREKTRNDAILEVTSKWGGSQSLVGPMVVVPYIERWTEENPEGQSVSRQKTSTATFLPETLRFEGKCMTEVLSRGIFEIPVYQLEAEVAGRFRKPDLAAYTPTPEDILWDQAYLSFEIQDVHALAGQTTGSWNDQPFAFLPSAGEYTKDRAGIHAPLGGLLEGDSFQFKIPMQLKGSVDLFFAPMGEETLVNLGANWPSPSFQGAWLPSKREFTEEGFEVAWSISSLGRNFPQNWGSDAYPGDRISASQFGVRMISPIDQYRMAHRSVKYQFLFLGLTFLTLWLFEILAHVRIHSIQYLFVGAAMCLFYLLELSLAEHLGFPLAYSLASIAVIALIAAYARSVLTTWGRALLVGLVVVLLYGFLYVLLMIQDSALLVGSIGLFAVLAMVMYLTRNLNWYTVGGDLSQGK